MVLGKNGTGKNGTGKNGTGKNGTGKNDTGKNGTLFSLGKNGTVQSAKICSHFISIHFTDFCLYALL